MPSDVSPAFKIEARKGNHAFSAAADASTGAVFPQQKGWLTWVYDLHVYLLAGPQYGMQINAVGSAVLLGSMPDRRGHLVARHQGLDPWTFG